MKKLINRVDDVLSEQLQGFSKAHPEINLHPSSFYVT
ncbi:dihydroxyacetone kinase, partial [Proteus mirabilis]|nr:dihydroxyacetone kinase [Proteus mirabilis]